MPKKKIYDIKPPAVARKLENTLKELGTPKKRTARKTAIPQNSPVINKPIRKFPLRWWVGGGVALLFIIVGGYLFNSLQRAQIDIKPAMDSVSLQEVIKADIAASQVNVANKVIPARYVEAQKDASQSFPATGTSSADGKATGTLIVYNKLSPSEPFTLKAGTHFLSDSGKYFVSLAKVVIPAALKGKPGSVSVKVQAEEVGTDYNIGASKFSVPKLAGTAYYYGIWAESTKAMSGGYIGNVKKVTQDDLDQAEDVVTKRLTEDALAALKQKLSAEEVLLDGAITTTIVNSASDQKVGAVADTFNESLSVKVSALVFSKANLQAFAQQRINTQLVNGKTVYEPSLRVDQTIQSVDSAKKIITLKTDISAQEWQNLDQEAIGKALMGKTADQIKEYLSETYGEAIEGVNVHFSPFWTNAAPNDPQKTSVKFNFQ